MIVSLPNAAWVQNSLANFGHTSEPSYESVRTLTVLVGTQSDVPMHTNAFRRSVDNPRKSKRFIQSNLNIYAKKLLAKT